MRRWLIAAGSASAFAALAVAVHLGLLNAFDSIVREWVRPDDVWGTAQVRADIIVEGLRPVVLAGLLAAFALAYCIKRRSLKPGAFSGVVYAATVALTVATKWAIGRPDTHGLLANNGGSFPSGHVISVIVCLGLVALVALPKAGLWIWLVPAGGGTVMGICLVIQAAHWSTDVVGGALLATAVLAAATSSGWNRWAHAWSENDHEVAGHSVSGASTLVGAASTHHWPTGQASVADSAVTDCYDPGLGNGLIILGGQ
jgi:membrane-associated phospholipid phosphatase